MFKCTGNCLLCKRCYNTDKRNKGKTKPLFIPDGFISDIDLKGYGIAFDIGTTTVAGVMWDFAKKELVSSLTLSNPQAAYGADVISRIAFADSEENLLLLQRKITECLNEIIDISCKNAGTENEAVNRISVCANPTMAHLLLGISPKSLAKAPYKPNYSGTVTTTAKELGLNIKPNAEVTVMPNIAGHVGSDITADILAIDMEKYKGNSLLVDIGTNGEIVYFNGKTMLACSAAAGPAFEGASIHNGMRAESGAIECFRIKDDDIIVSVIGDTEPRGICGSGIIDIASELVKNNIVDKTGRMLSENEYRTKYGESPLSKRLSENADGRLMIIAENNIVITQKDIREIQLAKAAIAAGIKALLKEAGDRADELDRIFLAGAFGSYIDKESAVSIGLLPRIDKDKIIPVGNAAGAGALTVLASSDGQQKAKRISETVKHINLYSQSCFQKDYLNEMAF